MTRVDLHIKVLNDRVLERAKRRGLDAIVYAPHFTRYPDIVARARAASSPELLVLPGRELFTGPWWNRRHVLALGLEEPIPDFLHLEATLQTLAEQDATVLAPHPEFFSISLSREELVSVADRIDAVEVYNPKYLPIHTRRAKSLPGILDLPAFGSSYAHLPGSVGAVWTEIDRPVDGLDALETAIREGAIGAVKRGRGLGHLTTRVLEVAHLGWENSWEKFDRVVREGLEPTHPAHPAYGGRFDDDAVY